MSEPGQQPYLLDVAPLLALLWEGHEHHERAMAWLTKGKLAVCPVTELGFLRISTQPAFGGDGDMAKADTVSPPPRHRARAWLGVGQGGRPFAHGLSARAIDVDLVVD